MVNTSKLQGVMRENGHTVKSLAEALGLSLSGLHNKIHNKREFLTSEVATIGKLLNLEWTDVVNIFFA